MGTLGRRYARDDGTAEEGLYLAGYETAVLDIIETVGGELDLRDHRQSHEAQRHERIDPGMDMQGGVGQFAELLQGSGDELSRLIGHQTGDLMPEETDDVPAACQDDTAFHLNQEFDRK